MVIALNDPCCKCLVIACCSSVCDDKFYYTDKCITELTNFINHTVYLDKLVMGSVPKDLIAEYNKLKERCEKNYNDMNTIRKQMLK